MSRNEDVTTGIWVDLMDLSPEAKLLYVWAFTNEHNGMSGLYKIHRAIISVETGLDDNRLTVALGELEAGGFAFYSDGVMLVRSRVKKLRSRTSQIAKSIAKDILRIGPTHPLRARFLTLYGGEPWLREAFSDAQLLNLKRASGEVHESPRKPGVPVNLTRTSDEVPGLGQGRSSSSHASEKVELPDDFPRELQPHLKVVFRVLRDLAERHHARAVAPRSLVAVVQGCQHKPLVMSAYAFVSWADGQTQPRKDVVSGYRRWLEKENDLAGFEQLAADGSPMNSGHTNGARPQRESPSDILNAMGYGAE